MSTLTAETSTGPFRWLADQVLAWLQERCQHPGQMVAVDILDGSAEDTGIMVGYCRRCGAVRVSMAPRGLLPPRSVQFPNTWRSPNPNLWRGK